MDVLNACYHQLNPRGFMFTHEIKPGVIKDHKIISGLKLPDDEVQYGFYEFFKKNNIPYFIKYLFGSMAIISFRNSLFNAYELDMDLLRYFRFPD